MCSADAISCALLALLCRVSCEPPAARLNLNLNSSSSLLAAEEGEANGGGATRSLAKDLPALKNVVVYVCAFTALLIVCLLVKVCRSGRKIRKTRKYDVITTSAEKVEMAPLNDDEDDTTLFDVKYR